VLFALILGLSLVAVWENRDSAEGHVQAEASSLHEAYLLADELPTATAVQIHAAVENYAHYVVEHEWPLMAGREPLGTTGWTLLDNVRNAYSSVIPANAAQQSVVSDALSQVSTLSDARRGRESDADKHMPDLLWIGLTLGGLLTIALTFVYGMEKRFTHIAMVMGLTALIGFLMVLIYNLDNPFRSGFGTDPGPFERYFPKA
jgi:hypothetical protein